MGGLVERSWVCRGERPAAWMVYNAKERCSGEYRNTIDATLYDQYPRLPPQHWLADSHRAHRIIAFVLTCRSVVLLRERPVDSSFLSYAAWADLWRLAIPVVGLAASRG